MVQRLLAQYEIEALPRIRQGLTVGELVDHARIACGDLLHDGVGLGDARERDPLERPRHERLCLAPARTHCEYRPDGPTRPLGGLTVGIERLPEQQVVIVLVALQREQRIERAAANASSHGPPAPLSARGIPV